jgi:hypothetical protein
MTASELSASLVKQFNRGGAVKIYPDASLLSFEDMMGSDEVTFTWLQEAGVAKYAFFRNNGKRDVLVTENGIQIARLEVEEYFLGNVVRHMQSCLHDPMTVVMNYDNKGNLVGKKEILN